MQQMIEIPANKKYKKADFLKKILKKDCQIYQNAPV